jgi:hypothetical protein
MNTLLPWGLGLGSLRGVGACWKLVDEARDGFIFLFLLPYHALFLQLHLELLYFPLGCLDRGFYTAEHAVNNGCGGGDSGWDTGPSARPRDSFAMPGARLDAWGKETRGKKRKP